MNDDINRVERINSLWGMVNETALKQAKALDHGEAQEYSRLQMQEFQLYARIAHHALELIKGLPDKDACETGQYYAQGQRVYAANGKQVYWDNLTDRAAQCAQMLNEQTAGLRRRIAELEDRLNPVQDTEAAPEAPLSWREMGYRLAKWCSSHAIYRDGREEFDVTSDEQRFAVADADTQSRLMEYLNDQEHQRSAFSEHIQEQMDRVREYLDTYKLGKPGDDMLEVLLADAIRLRVQDAQLVAMDSYWQNTVKDLREAIRDAKGILTSVDPAKAFPAWVRLNEVLPSESYKTEEDGHAGQGE